MSEDRSDEEISRTAFDNCLRRASPTPHTTEGREKAMEDAQRIVAWDDDGRLADDEWLVERNETAIIAICRALLSSPRVEDVRREALEEAAQIADIYVAYAPATEDGDEAARQIAKAIRSLSLPDGEGKEKLATRAEDGPTAPTDLLQQKESSK